MAKYGHCLTLDDFHRSVHSNKHSGKTTEKIDYLLVEGGPIKSFIHKTINEDKNINGYKSLGKFFKGSGDTQEPQQRTLLGHIAHLIVDEGCIFKIGDTILDETMSNEMMDTINIKYENDEKIQVIGFRGNVKSQTKSSNNGKIAKIYVPTEAYIEKFIRKIDPEGRGITEEYLFTNIENDFSKEGKPLKSDWKSKVQKIINRK